MKHEIRHDLDVALAKKATTLAFEAYQQRFAGYHPTMRWIGESDARIEFNVKGMKLQGTIGIQPKVIELDLEVPFLFRVFKSKAIDVIDREVKIWLEKAKRGELSGSTG
jgi:hypothetical protein